MCILVIAGRYRLLFPLLSQAGSEPLSPDLANDVREYHCIQAYLVSPTLEE